MEQIPLAYGLLKENVTSIMMLYKSTNAMVHSFDTNFFDIVTVVLLGDLLAPYLFIICLDYTLQISIDFIKENGFTLKKTRSRQYLTETLTDADYTDDQILLANTPAQAKSFLYRERNKRHWPPHEHR